MATRMVPFLLVSTLLFFLSVSALGAGGNLPPEQVADLILKILTYDKDLADKAGDSIGIGILVAPDGEREAGPLMAAFQKRSGKTVAGHPFKPVLILFTSGQALEEALGADSFVCLIVMESLKESLGDITDVTRRKHVLSLSLNREFVDPVSLALDVEDDRIRIYRSDSSLKAEEVNFVSQFIKITRTL